MKKKAIYILILLILSVNAYILTYRYSFFSEIMYKSNNNLVEKDSVVVAERKIVISETNKKYEILDSYDGTMTAYGADCFGCSGVTAYGYDIRNNNITYDDKTFGTLRIVAADRSIPFGTVVRINGLKVYEEPIIAIVLDRGSAIKGTLMDLAFGKEEENIVKKIGRSNVRYDILRYGW